MPETRRFLSGLCDECGYRRLTERKWRLLYILRFTVENKHLFYPVNLCYTEKDINEGAAAVRCFAEDSKPKEQVQYMIDQYRVRQMSRLAMIESQAGKNVIKVCSYRKSDYVIMQVIRGFFLGTVCFAAVLVLIFCFLWDDLNAFFADAQYMEFLRKVLIGYAVFMAAYLVLCALIAMRRYRKYEKIRRQYLKYLKAVGRSYASEKKERRQ